MHSIHGRSSWVLAAVVLAGSIGAGGAALVAQAREPSDDARTLQVVMFELRQLRQAIQELSRSQADTQALIALVAVHQSRASQSARSLDAARIELAGAVARGRAIAGELVALGVERGRTAGAERRAQLDASISQLTIEQAAVFEREQAGERRVGELLRQLQDEEARTTAAINRLEAIAR